MQSTQQFYNKQSLIFANFHINKPCKVWKRHCCRYTGTTLLPSFNPSVAFYLLSSPSLYHLLHSSPHFLSCPPLSSSFLSYLLLLTSPLYTKLNSFRLCLRMVSLTATKTKRMFSVSVAQVKCEQTVFSLSGFCSWYILRMKSCAALTSCWGPAATQYTTNHIACLNKPLS